MNNNIDYLYKTLEMSNISLLGYTSKVERVKDEFISKLPHIGVGYIDSSFSLVQFLRDYKIDNVLNNSNSLPLNKVLNWVVLDIGNIIVTRNSDDMEVMSNVGVRSNLIERISNEIFRLKDKPGIYDNLKLLITSPLHTSPNRHIDEELSFKGGYMPLLLSELSFIVKEDKIKVIKNRFAENSEVDVSNLKNYNYICNYEYSK